MKAPDPKTRRALAQTSQHFIVFARIGRWGTCVGCPRAAKAVAP